MLKHVFVLGLAAVGIVMLASPCHAQLIDPNADVMYHPADSPTAEAFLTTQILGVKATVVGAYAAEPNPPDPDGFYADSHTKVFADLEAGASGIIALDQFDDTRIMPNGKQVEDLRGVLLYLTIHLKGGRIVLDNEALRAIQTATLQIGVNLQVNNAALDVDFSASPFAQTSGALANDVDTNGTDPYDGQWPNPHLSDAELDLYSTGADKLAAIIDPNSFFTYAPIYVDLNDPAELALFTGNGTVDFVYSSSPHGHAAFSPSQTANVWSSMVTFDLEARLVYLYAGIIPEPASMGLLVAALAPILARRRRRRRMSRLT